MYIYIYIHIHIYIYMYIHIRHLGMLGRHAHFVMLSGPAPEVQNKLAAELAASGLSHGTEQLSQLEVMRWMAAGCLQGFISCKCFPAPSETFCKTAGNMRPSTQKKGCWLRHRWLALDVASRIAATSFSFTVCWLRVGFISHCATLEVSQLGSLAKGAGGGAA